MVPITGFIPTNLIRETRWVSFFHILLYPWTKNIPQGAATTIYAAVDPDLPKQGGAQYLSDCQVAPMPLEATPEVQAELWRVSVEATGCDL